MDELQFNSLFCCSLPAEEIKRHKGPPVLTEEERLFYSNYCRHLNVLSGTIDYLVFPD